jgi:signal transduction histidine kinase
MIREPRSNTTRTPRAQATSIVILAVGFGAVIALLGVLLIAWYFTVKWVNADVRAISALHQTKTELLASLRESARRRALSLHRMVVLDDVFERDAEYQQFIEEADHVVRIRDSFLALPLTRQEQASWDVLRTRIGTGKEVQERLADAILSGRDKEAKEILLHEVIPAQDNVIQAHAKLQDVERLAAHNATVEAEQQYEQALAVIIALGVFALLVSVVISVFAVHRVRLSERTLIAATRTAQESSTLKSEFLARISHELRTPLNAVIGYSEILMEDLRGTSRSDVEKIHASGRYLLNLINEVLDLSRVESGKMVFVQETIALQSLVDEVMATVRPLAEKNRNRLEVISRDVGTLHTDPKVLHQILLNLLSNACKFTANGTVTIEVTRPCDQNGAVEFKITDTGIGMSEDQLGRIFEPFVQADGSIAHRYGGTGLGLAITQRLCSALGGRIETVSEQGVGSTFSVWIPDQTATASAQPQADDGKLNLKESI